MPLEPHPPVELVLTNVQLQELDNDIVSAFENTRACANCGNTTFGLEAGADAYRTVLRRPGVNDKAQRLSPITKDLSDCPEAHHRVWACGTCRARNPLSATSLGAYVPTVTEQYCKALVSVPYEALHRTSFIDVSYKLTNAATGYVTGEFAEHSLLQSPILVAAENAPAHTYQHYLQLIMDELTACGLLYQHYVPLWNAAGSVASTLPARTFEHILATAQDRDPCTDRHEHHNRAPAILDVFANPSAMPSTSSAVVGTVRPVRHPEPVQITATPADLYYRSGRAAVMEDHVSVEHLLMPAFFPHDDGFYEQRKYFHSTHYLRLRCRQSFTPFTVQCPYLLMLRAQDLARSCILNSKGAYLVNRRAYDYVEQGLIDAGRDSDAQAVLNKLVKRKVSDNVEGSPQYFRREKLELDAMVRHLGLPSHFLTVTMNETGAHRAPEYTALDALISSWDDLLDWHNIPVECNRAFLMRFDHVWKNYILGGCQVLGDIKDFAIRFECQGRGSLHAHICIWLSDADALDLDRRIICFVPADYNGDTATFVPPVDPLLHRLYLHVLHKQQHRCRDNTDTKKGCICDGHCKLGFPQPLHDSHLPVLRDEKRRYKYRCPRQCDQRSVSMVPELGLLFDAHVNVVKVVDEEWSAYILKYSSKPPPSGDLDLRVEDVVNLGIRDSTVWKKAVAHRFAVTHVYQPAELALVATSTPIFHKSRTVSFVNINPLEERCKRADVFAYGTPRAEDQMGYCQRPDSYVLTNPYTGHLVDFKTVRCVDFHRQVVLYSKYQLNALSKVNDDDWDTAIHYFNEVAGMVNRHGLCPVHGALSNDFIGVSDLGLAYFWRKPHNLVRFPWVDPRKDFQSFCYHLLCENMYFSQELHVKNGHSTYSAAAYAAGIIDTWDRLYDCMAAHCKYVFASATLTDDDIQDAWHGMFEHDDADDLPPSCDFELDIARAAAIHDEASDLLPLNLAFDDSQSAAVNSILAPAARGVFIVRGGPGCGKSVIARYVAQQRASSDGVILMAPTNEVSQRLSKHSDTVHATANVPMGKTLSGMKPNHRHLRTLATCHTIIIDEAFMMTAQSFQYVLTRLCEAQDSTVDQVLASNTILLVGDERQLPPVCQASCKYLADVCTKHHLCTNRYFKDAWNNPSRQLLLDVNHRNPAMAHKLARIAEQHRTPLTQAWVDAELNAPFLSEELPLDLDCRVLCTHHVDATAHNTAAIQDFSHNSGAQLVPLTRKFARQRDDAPGLDPIAYDDLSAAEKSFVDAKGPVRASHLCIGADVRFNHTVAKKNGKTTAATGTVVGFYYEFGTHDLSGIQVLLHRTQKNVRVSRIKVQHCPPGAKYVQVAFWPLTLAYAATVHSVQGANISHPIRLDLRSCFDTGLAYTALSRNTADGALSLARPLTVHDLRVLDIDVYYAAKADWRNGTGPPPAPRQRVHVEDLLQ